MRRRSVDETKTPRVASRGTAAAYGVDDLCSLRRNWLRSRRSARYRRHADQVAVKIPGTSVVVMRGCSARAAPGPCGHRVIAAISDNGVAVEFVACNDQSVSATGRREMQFEFIAVRDGSTE